MWNLGLQVVTLQFFFLDCSKHLILSPWIKFPFSESNLENTSKLFGMHNVNIWPNKMKIDISVAYLEFWSAMNWCSKVWWNSLQLKCSSKKFKSTSPEECAKFSSLAPFLLALATLKFCRVLKWGKVKRNTQKKKRLGDGTCRVFLSAVWRKLLARKLKFLEDLLSVDSPNNYSDWTKVAVMFVACGCVFIICLCTWTSPRSKMPENVVLKIVV